MGDLRYKYDYKIIGLRKTLRGGQKKKRDRIAGQETKSKTTMILCKGGQYE